MLNMKQLLLFVLFILFSAFVYAQYKNIDINLRSFSTASYRITLLDNDENTILKVKDNTYRFTNGFTKNQTLVLSGSEFLKLKIGEMLPESIVYIPGKNGQLKIPAFENSSKGPIEFKGKDIQVSIEKASYQDLTTYRNLAFNPYDWQADKATFFPHIKANSECRNQHLFSARNTINGLTKNNKHSNWEDRSWGPEKINNPKMEIDFGRLVEIDKIVIYIRADFPHDGFWKSATIKFDDGSLENIILKKTGSPQTFRFPIKRIKSLKIEDLDQALPLNWCALTEVEVWGKEALPFTIKDSWEQTIRSIRWNDGFEKDNSKYWNILRGHFPVETDWFLQDTKGDFNALSKIAKNNMAWKTIAKNVIDQLGNSLKREQLEDNLNSNNPDFINIYLEACELRRDAFMSILASKEKEFIFVKRYRFTPSFFAYTEGLSDARDEHTFTPGAALCKATLTNGDIKITTLLEDPKGVIRDPDVSFDGKRILFAWKKSYKEDDYHLYEMNTEDNSIKQLTFGRFHADYEGKYLPNGDIIFNSTRCEQTVDCWKTEVSNLYLMKNDGRFMRRIGFDQVHTPYPTLMDNGKIVYTRWDYNDRGQTFPQPLFTMNPDGTGQTEYYGNNSWYPTTITHARQIPGTNKVLATLCGHHTWQQGKLGIINPSKGRQENQGVQLIAPIREEPPVRIDKYGQRGIQFQYPYPIDEDYFLVSADPINHDKRDPFFLYFMDKHGNREVLAWDEQLDCKQVVPFSPREKVFMKPSRVNYTKEKGTYYIQNVYHGEGSMGIEKGTLDKLRVVALDFRAAPVRGNEGSNDEGGVRVGNLASTPIALGQGAWDVKKVLGEVPIESDGSAMFEVPARTPVYFQLIDTAGYVAQTMRSWSTLQPGETFSCVGCHENKNESVPLVNKSIAMSKGVQSLKPFQDLHGEGFSFRKQIQPILNKHCISCHNNRHAGMLNDGRNAISDLMEVPLPKNRATKKNPFSLLDREVVAEAAGRKWNDAYLNLLQATYQSKRKVHDRTFQGSFKDELINWPGMQSVPTLLPPYFRGSATSKLMKMLKKGHGNTQLSKEEIEMIACWIDLQVPYCGDYKEANIWTNEETMYYDYYLNKRIDNQKEEAQNIKELIEFAGGD